MNILVVDDFAGNIASAKSTLPGHEVTAIDNILAAYKLLESGRQFDAVLVDLFMPIGKFYGGMNQRYVNRGDGQKQVPVGLVFAIKAANMGMRAVICTDANHHTDWMCALLDLVGYVYNPGTAFAKGDAQQKIAYVEARNAAVRGYWDDTKQEIVATQYSSEEGPLVKDWQKAMLASGLFPKLS